MRLSRSEAVIAAEAEAGRKVVRLTGETRRSERGGWALQGEVCDEGADHYRQSIGRRRVVYLTADRSWSEDFQRKRPDRRQGGRRSRTATRQRIRQGRGSWSVPI